MIIAGCSVWENFTAYYNTYFNASAAFEEAEESIKEQKKELFAFKEEKIPSSTNESLNKVIEKCSRILQFYGESSYVEDALFMTGKSFYYQQNYAKALRKFRELEAIPESDLQLENKYWVGKTELQMRNFDEGFNILEEVKKTAREEEENEILLNSYITQISYLLNRENYEGAVPLCNELIEVSDNDELNAEVAYELGKIYLELKDQENAAEAFSKVAEFSPTFEIEFYSSFEHAKLRKELGFVDESLGLLSDMKEEDKFQDFWAIIDLEIGKIYYDQNKIDEALEQFTIVDTTYRQTESSGIAIFHQGQIWEKNYLNYDSAVSYYNRVAGSSAPAENKKEAQKKSREFNKYKAMHKNLNKYMRQIEYIERPETFVEDSLAYEEYKSKDTAQAVIEPQGIFNEELQQTKVEKKVVPKPVRATISLDSLNSQVIKSNYEFGNLFFTDFNVPDSAYFYYTHLLNNYPDNRYSAKILYALGSYYLTQDESDKADSLFNVVYDNYPDDEIANEAAKKLGKEVYDFTTDPADTLYIKAENEFLADKFDNAVDMFFKIHEDYPESPLAPKALYTIGWILENNLNLPDSAASVYDSLNTQFSNTQYAKASQPKLYVYRQEQKRKQAVQDSILQAEQAKLDSLKPATEELTDSLSIDESILQPSEKDSIKLEDEFPVDSLKEEENPIDDNFIK